MHHLAHNPRHVALKLLAAGCIAFNFERPFTWSSGLRAPIYCDCRQLLSEPEIRDELTHIFSGALYRFAPGTQVIAAVATGGIALGMAVAQDLRLPLVYVRPEPKPHGRGKQVEGSLWPAARTLILEDLVSTGRSFRLAAAALEKEGADIIGYAALFDYKFKAFPQSVFCLTDFQAVAEAAPLSTAQRQQLMAWHKEPEAWSVAHGGGGANV